MTAMLTVHTNCHEVIGRTASKARSRDSGGGRPRILDRNRRFTFASRALRFTLVMGTIAQACSSVGCKDTNAVALHQTLTSLGVEDAPVRAPRVFRFLCDRSEIAPCDHGLALQVISGLAHEAYQRPGSHLEVYLMGESVAETRLIGSMTVPSRVDRGERGARAAEERFLQSVRPVLCVPLGAALVSPRPRRSPIAESLDKLSLAPTNGMPVEVIAVTDGHEYSDNGDFECGRLPSAQDFTARLRRRGLLAPGTYTNTRVHFVVGDRGPIPRRDCPVTMGRERAVMALWTTALRAAGAREITFHTEPPDFTTLFTEIPDAGVSHATSPAPRTESTPRRTR